MGSTFIASSMWARSVVVTGRLALLLVLVLVLVARDAAGQTAASIVGRVTDESGGVLPGVTVTATSPALQVPSVTDVTDADGQYRLTPLPIGIYSVEYSLSGFQPIKQEGIRLTAGFVARVDVGLKVGTLQETITVSGAAPVVDASSTAATTQLTREELELIPTNRNGINSLLVMAPGVRGTAEVGGRISFSPPQIRSFGQGAEPWFVVEGVYSPSPDATGSLGNYWDYNSLEEAVVQTVGTNAEVGGRGAYLNLLVRGGGNEFHGSSAFSYMSSELQGNNLTPELIAQGITSGDRILGRYDLSGDLGGYLVRDKVWFYAAVRDRQNYFETLGATPPPGKRNFQNQRGNVTGKASYQMNSTNKFIGWFASNRRSQESINRFTPWESRTDSPLWPKTWKAEWQSTFGDSMAVSAQWGRWGYVSPPRATSARGDWSTEAPTFDRITQMVSGANTAHGRAWDHRRHNPKATLSWYRPNWFLGDHELKAGLEYLVDRASTPFMPREAPNYRLIFVSGVATEIETQNTPVIDLQEMNNVVGYLQDNWQIHRRVSLNLGLRYDYLNPYVPPSCRDAAEYPAAALFPAQCFEKVQFNTFNKIAPRIRLAYDILGNGRTLIKGGWGRYYYRPTLGGDISPADPNATATARFRWNDPNRNRAFDPGEINLDPNGPAFIGITGGSNTIPNPDEKLPTDDQVSLSLERQLGATTGIRATAVYNRRANPYRVTNLLRPRSVYTNAVTRPDPGPDGVVGNADDPGKTITFYEYPATLRGRDFERFTRINDPDGEQTYKGIDVAFDKNLANGWMLSTSFSATKTHNPYMNALAINEFTTSSRSANDDPNAEINTANDTWEWLGRVTGSYVLPWDIAVSGVMEHRSGVAWARQAVFASTVLGSLTLNVEPIGSRRLPNTTVIDVRLEKTVRFPKSHLAKVQFNLYNLMNSNTILAVVTTSGSRFNQPSSILTPRVAELGISYRF